MLKVESPKRILLLQSRASGVASLSRYGPSKFWFYGLLVTVVFLASNPPPIRQSAWLRKPQKMVSRGLDFSWHGHTNAY